MTGNSAAHFRVSGFAVLLATSRDWITHKVTGLPAAGFAACCCFPFKGAAGFRAVLFFVLFTVLLC
jgi:hypothetical protein